MNDDEMDKIADAIATLVGQTNSQVAAVLTATWERLVGRNLLTPADLAEIVARAESFLAPSAGRHVIELLRAGLPEPPPEEAKHRRRRSHPK
jgi:hypothetical protein